MILRKVVKYEIKFNFRFLKNQPEGITSTESEEMHLVSAYMCTAQGAFYNARSAGKAPREQRSTRTRCWAAAESGHKPLETLGPCNS